MLAQVLSVAGQNQLPDSEPFPPIVFGLIAFATFLVLLAILWAFRSVGNRH